MPRRSGFVVAVTGMTVLIVSLVDQTVGTVSLRSFPHLRLWGILYVMVGTARVLLPAVIESRFRMLIGSILVAVLGSVAFDVPTTIALQSLGVVLPSVFLNRGWFHGVAGVFLSASLLVGLAAATAQSAGTIAAPAVLLPILYVIGSVIVGLPLAVAVRDVIY